jgi:hypothetical protein
MVFHQERTLLGKNKKSKEKTVLQNNLGELNCRTVLGQEEISL